MRFRGLIFATALLLALVGVLYWSNHHKNSAAVEASADSPTKILTVNEADLSRIDVRKKGGSEVVLAKHSGGKWQITSPEALSADESAVSGVVSTLSSLNSERVVEDKPDDLTPFGLNQPSLEVDVAQTNGTQRKLMVGDDTPTGNAAFVKLADDPRVFTIASYVKASLDKSLNDLRDKRLLTIEPNKVSRLDFISSREKIEFGRDKSQWQIVKPMSLRADSLEVDELVRKLVEAKMDLTSNDEKKAALAFASGKRVAAAMLTTDSGTQQLEVRKNKDEYYAKSTALRGAHKVASDLGQSLSKTLNDFRNRKLFDFGFSDPGKIEIREGSRAYFLTKGGADWWSADGQKLEMSGAAALVSKIRDLKATKFVDSGFGTSVMDLRVTSSDGKSTEQVAISKKANDYVAKRKNEPALYVLSSTAVEELQKSANELKPAAAAKNK